MAILQQNFDEKPYNRCVTCDHIGIKCDGPNFLAMELPRLAEWCRLRKEYLHRQDPKWTNAYIAEQAKMSKISVDRFISGNAEDVKISTITAILKVLVDGSWGQYPCAWSANESGAEENKDLKEEIDRLQERLDVKRETIEHINKENEDLHKQIEFKNKQMEAKDKQIAERGELLKDRKKDLAHKDIAIATLSILLFICLAVIIGALVVDSLNPDVGFFWLEDVIAKLEPTATNVVSL